MKFARPVYLHDLGVISAVGEGYRGLAGACTSQTLTKKTNFISPSFRDLDVRAATLPVAREPQVRRRRQLMSRAAVLAESALAQTANLSFEDAGFFLGVGASGGDMKQLEAVVAASMDTGGGIDMAAVGNAGLKACNPLYAFQLMNNFTLCHAAIAHDIRGPNLAMFSRGVGTVSSMIEGAWALIDQTCPSALVGGADSCLHDLTLSELTRLGYCTRGLVPGEGAAILRLGLASAGALARFVGARAYSVTGWSQAQRDFGALPAADSVVMSAWGPPAVQMLRAWAPADNIAAKLGETLAAAPALAAAVALDHLAAGASRVFVVSAGIDGGVGIQWWESP